MERIQVLIFYRPDVEGCQAFDQYIDVDSSATFADIYNEAVDNLHNQLTGGALRDSLPASGGCDVTSYEITVGPILAELA